MKTLGIIGGMSPESTVTYYSQINRLVNQAKGGNHSATLLMVSVEFEQIVQCQKTGNWQQAGEILADAALTLEKMGADGILLATNTMHKVADYISRAVTIPFLHIIDATAQHILDQNISTVALLGTRFTMQDDFYRNGLSERGISAIVPSEEQQAEIHRIIFEELCVGKLLPESKQYYLQVIADLQKLGAEGIILGCTEIGLLIEQTDFSLPFFDTAEIHSKTASTFILDGE
ncbi:aspartate/glutamate racemase family protein [Neisseria weaveri]|uniref:aspartate/glutamate racemase family protein n=1 Tax=Neisseria weaveri TaxID=28091 RepID=UPI0007C9A412|nr:aspartate/glutamate racemase family protein [Neisseria weaveri]SAY50578.1 putative racemase [Neisseria weaveri]